VRANAKTKLCCNTLLPFWPLISFFFFWFFCFCIFRLCGRASNNAYPPTHPPFFSLVQPFPPPPLTCDVRPIFARTDRPGAQLTPPPFQVRFLNALVLTGWKLRGGGDVAALHLFLPLFPHQMSFFSLISASRAERQ